MSLSCFQHRTATQVHCFVHDFTEAISYVQHVFKAAPIILFNTDYKVFYRIRSAIKWFKKNDQILLNLRQHPLFCFISKFEDYGFFFHYFAHLAAYRSFFNR